MIRIFPWVEILLGTLIWLTARGGARSGVPASATQLLSARFIVLLGVVLTLSPVAPLLGELPASGSASEGVTTIVFTLLLLLWIAPAWLWLGSFIRRRNASSFTKSVAALIIAGSLACYCVAIRQYLGFLSGSAESQSGIVVFLVPVQQLVVVAALVAIRRLIERPSAAVVSESQVRSTAA